MSRYIFFYDSRIHSLKCFFKTFDQLEKLDKVTGAFYEALRLFPSGALMIREAIEDTVLHVPNPPEVGGERALAMPKGSQVAIDMVGVRE